MHESKRIQRSVCTTYGRAKFRLRLYAIYAVGFPFFFINQSILDSKVSDGLNYEPF